jgi:hypothetical protein
MHLILALFLIPCGVIHFLPTIIAALRNGRSVVGIFLLNLFLSWTIIGWVVALIWALTNEPKWVYGYPPPGYRRY